MIEWKKNEAEMLVPVDAKTGKPVGPAHAVDGRDNLTVELVVKAFKSITQKDSMYLAQVLEAAQKSE